MSRFLALVNASDPQLLSAMERANAAVVIVGDGGVLVVDGDADAAQAVGLLAAVREVGPVDAPWDTSSLGLDDGAVAFVEAWNAGYDESYVAAAEDGFRRGEAWDFPDGCFQSGVTDDDGLVASALPDTFGGDDGDANQVAQNDPPSDSSDDAGSDGDGNSTDSGDSDGGDGETASNADNTDDSDGSVS